MISRLRALAGTTLWFALCVAPVTAWGQQPATEPGARTTEPAPPAATAPPVTAYPLELLGLLAPPAQRGPITLTPSIGVSEEYNDNIFQDNRNRESDFITSFSPALTLFVNKPSYSLSAGYSFSADIYAKESRLNNAFDRQNFVANGLYRASQVLTLTVSDVFALDRNSNIVAGTSTGRQESWNNTFTPGLIWQVTPRDSLNLNATYSALRFTGEGGGLDSDTYGFDSLFNHAFTPRLTGSAGYSFTYLALTGGQEDAMIHKPLVGLSYLITPTLTAAISGGPAITETGGDTIISPAGTASLTQIFSFGTASVQYSQTVATAGGFGGTNETKTAQATLALNTLRPGLVVAFTPAYSESKSLKTRQNENVDVKAFNLTLAASYLIARYTTIFAGYTFLHQRTESSTSVQQLDVDQNRVRFGLQFGYPFNFD